MFCNTEDTFILFPHCLSLSILPFDFSSSLLLSFWLYKRTWHPVPDRMVPWNISLPSSWSPGFQNKIIFLTSTPHLLDSLACHVVSRMNLGSGTLVASEGRGENNCYGQTGTPIFEKFWLIRNANVNCTLVWKRKGPNGHRQRSWCLNFLDVP